MSFFGMFGKEPKELFLEFSPRDSHWRIVTWNFDLESSAARMWTVEVHKGKPLIIQWEKSRNTELRFYEGTKLLRRRGIPEQVNELRDLMNLSIHSTLKAGLEANHDFMVTPVSGATALDIQTESRALQWIQATFLTVLRALDNFKSNRDLILTAAAFMGRVPESGEEVVRVIIFNLDIFFYLRPDYSLQIVIFDDKNLGHGETKTPTFQQIIKVTKPQFYDEISRLLHRIAQVGEIG